MLKNRDDDSLPCLIRSNLSSPDQILVSRADGTARWVKTPRWAWLALGLGLAFLSHALIDAMAIFTYHESSPYGSIFSRLVFWSWLFSGAGIIT